MELLQQCGSFDRQAAPVATSAGPATVPRGSDALRESLQAHAAPMQKSVVVYVRVLSGESTGGALKPVTCDWDADLATCVAKAAMPHGGGVGPLAATLRMTVDVAGHEVDVSLKTAGETALLVPEHVVVEVSGMPSGLWD